MGQGVMFGVVLIGIGSVLTGQVVTAEHAPASTPQNVLWISIDDQSPWYGTYGDNTVATQNIDQLAAEGVVFERAYAPTPVCSPSRSAMITGNYSIRLGTHDHRSGRVPSYQIELPEWVQTLPELFRAAGFETYNSDKDDFNFSYERSDLYSLGNPNPASVMQGKTKEAMALATRRETVAKKSVAVAVKEGIGDARAEETTTLNSGQKGWKGVSGGGDWRDVPEGASFFGQMSIAGGKRVRDIASELEVLGLASVSPKAVRVPAQYPDIPQLRQHVANHYSSILRTDHQVGQVVARLKADGLWHQTVIFLYSDHGSDLPRSKEFCYAEGLHVPLIVVAPGRPEVVPGTRRSDLVNLMDIAATSLALAGLDVPDTMDARNLFAPDYARSVVFSSADRMSNVLDRVRSVMGDRYHYIRNFYTDRPLMNWGHREMIALADPEASSFLMIRRLAEAGRLTPAQAAPYGARAAEELYDLMSDPDEVVNLADDPAYRAVLEEKREQLDVWVQATDDKGQYPRSAAALQEITGRFPKAWLRSPEFSRE